MRCQSCNAAWTEGLWSQLDSPRRSGMTGAAPSVSSLAVWDGVHFLRAAKCGYEYEQSFAFLRASLNLLARSLFAPLVPLLGYRAVLVISGYVLNNVAFVAAAAYLYRYSESLYTLFSLGGLFYLFTSANIIAMIMLALSGSARSNGALNAEGVGFLRYFQVKQLPNFLLASPVLSLAVYSIIHYTKMLSQLFKSSSIHELIVATVEGRSIEAYKSSDVDTVLKSGFSTNVTNKAQGHEDVKRRKSVATETDSASIHNNRSNDQIIEVNKDVCPIIVLPFILHLAFMTFIAFFVMHVQVSTRFLSASPPIYWAASHILASPSCSKRWCYLICVCFIAYILVGSLLFSNFYPFT